MSLREFSEYAREYLAGATQLATYRLAREWMEAGVPVRDAAAWASLGYQPGEATPLIAAGVTPHMAGEMDQIAVDLAGSPEERAAQSIDRLVADGALVDPQQVQVRQDRDDPYHVIVHVEDDTDEA